MFVNLKGVELDDALHSVRSHLLLTQLDGVHEEGFVPVQTELIHNVDLIEIIENEEKNGSLLSACSVKLSGVINLLHGDLSLLQCLLDLIRCLFGGLKGVDKFNILK